MPENEPVLGAPARLPLARLGAVADALGTSPARLVGGLAVAAVVLAAVAWTLLASPSSSVGGVDAAVLPRASVASTTSAVSERSLVYVTGAVASPGVYRLRPGARVADVLDAAGGPLPDADVVRLNLAAVVADGERVYVPRKGEELVPPEVGAGPAPGPVNLNTATADQLDALPGIGPATADAIVAWRRDHGRFKTVDDLLNVRGIGPAKLDALRKQVRV